MKLDGKLIRSECLPRHGAALALIFAVMLPSFYWVLNDHHIWPWDPSWYGEVSVDLWFQLGRRFSRWAPEMFVAFGSKAPGIAWLGQFFVPLGRAMGSVESGLLLSIVAVQLGSLFFAWKIVEALAPGRRLLCVACVLVFASAPLFVAMSHQYFAEPLQLFGVTYFYFLAATGHGMRRVALLGNLLLATSIALLAKITSPIYCGLPGLIVLYDLFQLRKSEHITSPKRARWGWVLMSAGVILCVACGIWYLRNFPALRETLKRQTSLEFTLNYGRPGTFFEKLRYWLHAMQWNFQLPSVIVGQLLLVGAGLALARFRRAHDNLKPDEGAGWRFDLLAICSVIHILTVLSLCSLNYNEENRYLLPLLPAIATVNIWLVSKIRQSWLLAGVILLLAFQWVAVCSQALGWGSLGGRNCAWLVPLERDRKPANELIRIVRRTSNLVGKARQSIVGVELPWLSAGTLSFFSAKDRLETRHRCYYSSLGFAAKDLDMAWQRMKDLNPGYFISVEETAQSASPDFLNAISIPALRRIRDDPDFVPEPFTSDLKIVLFRRKAESSPEIPKAPAQ